MTTTRVTNSDLHTMSGREDENSAVVAAWAQPDTALLLSVLTTHGAQAVSFVEGLVDYYVSREVHGTTQANNYATTASSLRQASELYTGTDGKNAGSLGSIQV